MATLRDPSLTELTAPAANDRVLVSDTSDGTYKDKWMALAKLAIVSLANTFAALQTFSAGLTFGQNTLDYYKTATAWTPTSPQLTWAGAAGEYMRSGTLVLVSFRIPWGTTSDTNQATITGLPFTPAVVSTRTAQMFGGVVTDPNGSAARFLVVDNDPASIRVMDGNIAALTNANLSGKTIRGAAWYWV